MHRDKFIVLYYKFCQKYKFIHAFGKGLSNERTIIMLPFFFRIFTIICRKMTQPLYQVTWSTSVSGIMIPLHGMITYNSVLYCFILICHLRALGLFLLTTPPSKHWIPKCSHNNSSLDFCNCFIEDLVGILSILIYHYAKLHIIAICRSMDHGVGSSCDIDSLWYKKSPCELLQFTPHRPKCQVCPVWRP